MTRVPKIIIVLLTIGLLLPSLPVRAYNYAGYRWGGAYPTVGMDTTQLYATAYQNAATDAMNSWNATGSRWRVVNYKPSSNTIYNFYDPGSTTLAQTKNYRNGFIGDVYRTTIAVNNAKNFYSSSQASWYDLRSVLRHELGHSLVLNHEERFYTLMNPTFGIGEVRNITSDESTAIRNIYGLR